MQSRQYVALRVFNAIAMQYKQLKFKDIFQGLFHHIYFNGIDGTI